MAGSTTNKGLPYPVGTESVDVVRDIQALAEAVDTKTTAYAKKVATIPSTSAGWYRIAVSPVDIQNISGQFNLKWSGVAQHGNLTILAGKAYAGSSYNDNMVLNQVAYAAWGADITKARMVYHSDSGSYAYLEVYYGGSSSPIEITAEIIAGRGWTLLDPNTAGNIPEGYSYKEISLIQGISIRGEMLINNANVLHTGNTKTVEGSYVGNGVTTGRDISMGFDPDLVNIYPTVNTESLLRVTNSKALKATVSGANVYMADVGTGVTIRADGIRIGNGSAIANSNGVTYYYEALKWL